MSEAVAVDSTYEVNGPVVRYAQYRHGSDMERTNEHCSHVLAYLGCVHRHMESNGEGPQPGKPFPFPADMPCMALEHIHKECKWRSVEIIKRGD